MKILKVETKKGPLEVDINLGYIFALIIGYLIGKYGGF